MRKYGRALLMSSLLLGQLGCEPMNSRSPQPEKRSNTTETNNYDAVSEGLNSYIENLKSSCEGLNIDNHSYTIQYDPITRHPKITLTIFYKYADTLNSQDFTFSEPVDMNGQSAGQIVNLIIISLEAKIMRFFQARGTSCDKRIQRASNTPTRGYARI